MGSESSLWRTLNKNMKERWQAERIESFVSCGVPDIYFTLMDSDMGWMELKHLHEWPKRESTIVKIEHYTPQQKNWIRRHGIKGANVSLLLQVGHEYMLYDWPIAVDINNYVKKDMIYLAMGYWKNRIDYDKLYRLLRRH